MKHHVFCLTIDVDPDGLSGKLTNRRALAWKGLEQVQQLPYDISDSVSFLGSQVPITWFVRIDGQLRDMLGTSLYLLEEYETFWDQVKAWGQELGWHPHLYRQSIPEEEPSLITDPNEACDELELLWDDMKSCSFLPKVFRNGEGWHHAQIFSALEMFGIFCDSTAIPGCQGGSNHPMSWIGTPNQPYFPDALDIRRPGVERPLLEMPMNTWYLKAPYESRPRLRYMNPAVHEKLFAAALDDWENIIQNLDEELCVWVLIFHPDEAMTVPESDFMYAHSRQTVCRNLISMIERVRRKEWSFEFVTLFDAAVHWKQYKGVCL
jgi:hypothetical protein